MSHALTPLAVLRRRLTGVAFVTAAAAAAGTVTAHAVSNHSTAARSQAALELRVERANEAAAEDVQFAARTAEALRKDAAAAMTATAVAEGQEAIASANATVTAATHAGQGERDALAAALTIAQTDVTKVGAGVSVAQLRDDVVALASAQQAVAASEQAWVDKDRARRAAERAAAERAKRSHTAQRPAGPTAAASASTTTAAGPTGHSLTCTSSPAAGAGESAVAEIGAAINAYRATLGLPGLSVARSESLVGHAANMAAYGTIWHSGQDNIVGCVKPGTAPLLVKAWAASPPHDTQMRRTDVSSMLVGSVTSDGWLYGAVRFR